MKLHSWKYKKLINGTRKHKLITVKAWLWGFGMSYETKKSLGGFTVNGRDLRDITTDKRIEKK
jgi:hypothetical protein